MLRVLKKTTKPNRQVRAQAKGRTAALGVDNVGEKSKSEPSTTRSQGIIFVVDDNVLLVECTATLLETEGYSVKSFSDPKALLQEMEKGSPKPSVLVTDYDMGEWNGLDLIENCHKIHPALKTILMSGTVDSSISANHKAKVHHFLGKPYQPAQLKKLVAELMRG
jgi:DNA-binding NtrC family response regulator